MKKIFAICTILLALVFEAASEKKIVCYWNSFSRGNEGLKGFFDVKDIDPAICTHIIYTYIRFTNNVNFFSDYDPAVVQQFTSLKSVNPNVKLLIGIGGPRQGTQIPSKIASTATDREEFSQKVKKFIDDYNFDGCDFDWQWPGQGSGSSPNDKNNYVKLLQNLRQVLPSSKVISISVAPKQEDIDKSYDIQNIINHVDFINLNTYNFHGLEGETVTAFHSPYRSNPNDTTIEAEWNTVSIVENWLRKGCPAEKLTLGIPTYGRSFTLSNILQTGVGAPIKSLGSKSEYLADSSNIIPYVEICYNLATSAKWIDSWNSAQFAPYAVFSADQWVGFDNIKTVRAKISLAIENNLGGLNYATIDRDDFYGQCNGPKFPLIKAGYDAVINDIPFENPLETTVTSTPTTTTIPTTTVTTTQSTSTTTSTTPSTTTATTTRTKDPDEDTRPSTTTTIPTTTTKKTTVSKTTTKKTTTSEIPTPPHNLGSSSLNPTTQRVPDDEIVNMKTSTTTIKTSTTAYNFPTPPVTPGQRSIAKRSAEFKTNGFICPESDGQFKHPSDCQSYILCKDFVPYEFFCNINYRFNEIHKYCDHHTKVLC